MPATPDLLSQNIIKWYSTNVAFLLKHRNLINIYWGWLVRGNVGLQECLAINIIFVVVGIWGNASLRGYLGINMYPEWLIQGNMGMWGYLGMHIYLEWLIWDNVGGDGILFWHRLHSLYGLYHRVRFMLLYAYTKGDKLCDLKHSLQEKKSQMKDLYHD